jgi:proteic killer suppression protein
MIKSFRDARAEAILKGRRPDKGFPANLLSINDQWRICFVWTGADAEDVEIVDYH